MKKAIELNILCLFVLALGFTFSSCDSEDDEIQNFYTEFYNFNIQVTLTENNSKTAENSNPFEGAYAIYMDHKYPLMAYNVAKEYWNTIIESTANKPWDYKFDKDDPWQFIPYTKDNYPPLGVFLGFTYLNQSSTLSLLQFGNLPLDDQTNTLIIHWNDNTPDDVLTMTRQQNSDGKVTYIKTLNGTSVTTEFFEIKK